MRRWLAPAVIAAVTKSSCRIAKYRPRTTRASSVQAKSDTTIVIAKNLRSTDQSAGNAAAKTQSTKAPSESIG